MQRTFQLLCHYALFSAKKALAHLSERNSLKLKVSSTNLIGKFHHLVFISFAKIPSVVVAIVVVFEVVVGEVAV